MSSDVGVEEAAAPAKTPQQDFKDLMSRFPTGVTAVTTLDQQGEPVGFTCSSLCAVSVAPPLLLVCVCTTSRTLAAIERLGVFAVNLLHDRGRHTAELFSADIGDRFSLVSWRPTSRWALPFLAEAAHGVAECAVHTTSRAGDHTIVVGEVCAIALESTVRAPLLYGLRRYSAWPEVIPRA